MKVKHLEDKKQSINLFLLVFGINIAVFITKSMFTSAMAVIVEDGVMTKSQTGLIAALFWIVYAVFQIIGGFMVEKIPLKKSISIGIISGIIANAIIFFNHSYGVIITVWCINAAFQFGLWPASFKIVSTQTNKNVAEVAVLWITFTASAGEMLSLLLASFTTRWHYNFGISVIILIVTLIIWNFLYPYYERKMKEEEINFDLSSTTVKHKSDHKFFHLMLVSGLLVIMFLYFISSSIRTALKISAPVMLMENYDNLPAAITTRLGIILIGFSTLGIFLSNFIRWKIKSNELKISAYISMCTIPFLAGVLFTGKISYWWILIFLTMASILLQAAMPFMGSLVSARFGRYGFIGTVTGIMNGFSAASYFMSSYLFPKLAEALNWRAVTIVWVVLMIVLVIGLYFILNRWIRFVTNKY